MKRMIMTAILTAMLGMTAGATYDVEAVYETGQYQRSSNYIYDGYAYYLWYSDSYATYCDVATNDGQYYTYVFDHAEQIECYDSGIYTDEYGNTYSYDDGLVICS